MRICSWLKNTELTRGVYRFICTDKVENNLDYWFLFFRNSLLASMVIILGIVYYKTEISYIPVFLLIAGLVLFVINLIQPLCMFCRDKVNSLTLLLAIGLSWVISIYLFIGGVVRLSKLVP